ncbi:extensin-like [Anneissia japonica]|uniref:extensin-like n=1 Tax=Anneissia japonica TaxID=1529436 RepID=UPI0014255C7A|nr:extensin-like [Anneissia japonica]
MELFQMLGNLITKSSASQQPTSSSALSHPHMHPLQYNSSQTSHSMPSTRQPTTTAASLRPHHMHTSHQMPNPKQPTTTTASSRPHNMHASHQMPNSKQPISTSASSTPHHMHPSPNSMTPWDHARDYETLVLPPRPRLTNRQDPPNPDQPSTTMLQSLFKPWQGL